MSSLSDLQSLFFLLLQAGLRPTYLPEKQVEISPEAWKALYSLANAQGVTGLIWDGAQRLFHAQIIPSQCAIPRLLKIQWALNIENIQSLYERQRRAIGRLAGFLQQHQIPMMVIKGYGLSLYYPTPEHRPCGDIDIWLFGKQEEADELLRKELDIKINVDVHHHTTFLFDGIMVENHFDFLNQHSHLSNRTIEAKLQAYALQPTETVSVEGATVHLPSADFNALFLLRHAAVHFAATEIGMRQVVDWLLFVEHNHAKINWEELETFARKMNMHHFLHCINAILIDHLGMKAGYVPDFQRNKPLENRVLNDIFSPEFSEQQEPRKGLAKIICFRFRRWWHNRWKHRIVFREGLLQTFFVQVRSHLMKPQSLTH